MYHLPFGLDRRSFALAPDPERLFWTERHHRAYRTLERGVAQRTPIILMTGEIGTGKTTVLHRFIAAPREGVRVGLLCNFAGLDSALYAWALMAFGEESDGASEVADLARLEKFLAAEFLAGRHVVLAVDEAQNVSDRDLEKLRQLTNINSGSETVLTLVLVGQPPLRTRLERPDHAQTLSRVGADFHISTMGPDETAGYLRHRLLLGGARADLIEAEAARAIHGVTGGVPRLVNLLADLCLCAAASERATSVTAEIVRAVAEDARRDGLFAALRPTAPVPEAQPTPPQRPAPREVADTLMNRLGRAVAAEIGAERRIFLPIGARLLGRRVSRGFALVAGAGDAEEAWQPPVSVTARTWHAPAAVWARPGEIRIAGLDPAPEPKPEPPASALCEAAPTAPAAPSEPEARPSGNGRAPNAPPPRRALHRAVGALDVALNGILVAGIVSAALADANLPREPAPVDLSRLWGEVSHSPMAVPLEAAPLGPALPPGQR